VGVEGRAVAARLADELVDEVAEGVAADPDAVEAAGEATDVPDWHLLEKGLIDFATYFERIRDRAPSVLGRPIDLDAYGRFMRSSAPGVHWMVVHRIRSLKRSGLRLGLLTNNVKEFGEHWRATFPIEELFEEIVDSSHVGMRKPDAEIYLLMCKRMGIEPSDAVFVDDNADNVAAARALGMEAVHFGADPWAALHELDAVLERRGTSVTKG
jgi:epoxide hydrolase-like predicted phosphatase